MKFFNNLLSKYFALIIWGLTFIGFYNWLKPIAFVSIQTLAVVILTDVVVTGVLLLLLWIGIWYSNKFYGGLTEKNKEGLKQLFGDDEDE